MSGLEEAVLRNISAVNELSEIVRTSFGPNGMYSFSPTSNGAQIPLCFHGHVQPAHCEHSLALYRNILPLVMSSALMGSL